eukprot:m.31959 g.31959  ORF g.31959 m.31959 type:complete len:221 (-) comp12382_c0_seq1:114-776(-)
MATDSYLEMGPDGAAPATGDSYLEMSPSGAPGGYLDMTPDDSYLAVTPDQVFQNDAELTGYLEMSAAAVGDDGGYLAVDQDWLSEQWDLMAEQPWFRGDMKRDTAKKELQKKSVGSFVVRVSQSEPGHFALSVVQEGAKLDHMLVLPSFAGHDSTAPGKTQYRLGTYSKFLFNTIPKLCAYYIGHPYIGNSRLLGQVVPEKQEGGYLSITPNTDALDDYE